MRDEGRFFRNVARLRSAVFAAAFVAAFVGLYATAILSPVGQLADATTLGSFPDVRGDRWLALYEARDWVPFVLLGLGAIAGIEGIVRRRWTAVVASGLLVSVTALASFTFKAGLLPRPYFGDFAYTYQTYPSGHTAVSLAAVVALIWFAPRWLPPFLVPVFGLLVWGVAVASLLSFAHRASDIIGGALLVGAFAFTISTFAAGSTQRWSTARIVGMLAGVAALALGVVLGALGIAAVGAAPSQAWTSADSLGVAAVALTGGVITIVLAGQRPLREFTETEDTSSPEHV